MISRTVNIVEHDTSLTVYWEQYDATQIRLYERVYIKKAGKWVFSRNDLIDVIRMRES